MTLAHRTFGAVGSGSAGRCAACGTEQPCETLRGLADKYGKSPVWDAPHGIE